MKPDEFASKISGYGQKEAIATETEICSFSELSEKILEWEKVLERNSIAKGAVVSIFGEYGPESIALLLALMKNENIIVPITVDSFPQKDKYTKIAQVEWEIDLTADPPRIEKLDMDASHELYEILRNNNSPGLILFSSGSTGEPKAAVHDLCRVLSRYEKPGTSFRMLVFLQMDHIGGVNSLFYGLANGGLIVIPKDRSPDAVASAIEKHKVDLLPTSPTFLNLLLISEAHTRYDLSSLKMITYGTEPMPESSLRRAAEAFPNVQLKQTYGLSEVGILYSQSKDNKSLWFKIGGAGFDVKIVNNRLWIKSKSAMLEYLNAPSPFDEEGYLDTGDLVEQDGEWIRILGRESELINVGGNKVFPAEVENVIGQMEDVEDVIVYGQPNPITGNAVAAVVRLRKEIPLKEFKTKMRVFCKDKLEPFKIPAKISVTQESLHSSRFKKIRKLRPQ